MDRLTEHKAEGIYLIKTGYQNCQYHCENRDSCDNCAIQEAFDKLARYEDLEEQGRLVELPCKICEKAYHITENFKEETVIVSGRFHYTWLDNYEYIYATREEAEAKLAELEGGAE